MQLRIWNTIYPFGLNRINPVTLRKTVVSKQTFEYFRPKEKIDQQFFHFLIVCAVWLELEVSKKWADMENLNEHISFESEEISTFQLFKRMSSPK